MSIFPILAEEFGGFVIGGNSLLAIGSAVITGYFWLIKANKERTSLKMYQGSVFRVQGGRRFDDDETQKWYMWLGDLYVANKSISPNAVIDGKCAVKIDDQWVEGDFGWQNEAEGSQLPWNLAPQRVERKSLALFAKLPADSDFDKLREEKLIRITLFTMDGKKFTQEFTTTYTPPSAAESE